MPVKSCTSKGIAGWQWGDSGTCYTGEGAKAKATKQGQAIQKSKKTTRAGGYTDYKPRKKMMDDAGKW